MAVSFQQILKFGAILGFLPALAVAGSKATIYGCVDYKVDPAQPFDVSFTAGSSGDKCMSKTGSHATATVRSKGLTCASLGDVDSNNDGTCYWKSSYWGMSYSADGITGAMTSQWSDNFGDSYIELETPNQGSNVCTNKAHCEAKKQRWDYDKRADIYVVFSPEGGASNHRDEL